MKLTHAEGPDSILKSRFARGVVPLMAALLAFALAAPEARADVLVYEGFSSSDYTATSDYTASSLNGKKSGIDSIGLDKVNGWNSGTGVFVAQPNGLPLPDIWKDGTVHGTKDLRAVLYNTTATSTTRDNRAQQRALTCEWPTSGSIYFRFLMQVPQAALNTTYLGNWNYWIAGLGTEAIEKPTTGDQCNIANGIYMGVRNRNGTLEVAAYVKNPADGATFTKPLFTIDTSKTLRCACIAKIDIGENGNDTLSFYAAPTNTLTTDFEWTFTTNGIALVSGSAKPSYLQMLGHYKVNSQYITFDEFLVTTDEDEAYAHASRLVPALGTVAMSRTGAAEYSLSADEDANAADVAWIANDGASVTTNGWKSVVGGATASWTISNLSADKTYKISILATNENGTVEADAGTLYTGVLSLGATTDANEKGLVAGGVTVSRVNDDSLPLTVNYTISGSAGTEGTTWEVPVAVTIPANAASAVLPVVPLDDVTVDEDVTITVTLLAGNYEMPGTTTATLTLRNRVPVEETDFVKKMTLTPSATALAKIGEGTFANFPVLVRLPAEVSGELRSANGTDLFFKDENNASLPFEVDTFDPAGETLVWVKVPSLSSATKLTAYFGGAANVDNDPTAVWTNYAGVWHMNEASGTVADATGNGLGASSAKSTAVSIAQATGAVGTARQTATSDVKDYLTIPNYDSLGLGANFTFSCFYDATARKGYDRLVSRKREYNDGGGWEVELANASDKLSARGSSDAAISASFSDIVSSGWMRFAFVYRGSTLTAFLDGAQIGTGSIREATENGYPLSIGCDSDGSEAYFVGAVDEARLRKGAASAAETALEYATMADAAFFDSGTIEPVDATAQVFDTPTVVRNANGTYTVTVVLSENSGDVGVIYDAGETAITNVIQATASPGTYTDTPVNLTANTTYKFAAYGKNAKGTEVIAKGGAFYNGDISIEKISDANENGLVTGVFRISRADTTHDLTITYTIDGTATPGQTYETLSGTATIPAGSSSVDVEVVPLIDAQTTEDKTVSVTLAAGLYGIDAQAGSAEMTVVNLSAPTGYNTWIAPSAGLASVGSNWSEGHAPLATENVLFDGRFSTENCEWDAAASATVASWTQTNGYTGTVTFDTEFPDYSGATFPLFTISGDCVIASGKWSCRGNYNNYGAEKPSYTYKTDKRWCLNVAVGGAMQVASGASITATGRGFGFPNDSSSASKSYGGYAYGGGTAPYGSIKEPFDPGMGARAQGDQNGRISAIGGGAIKIAVTGALTLDGSIVALGTADQNIARAGGTGGSIWISASQISGAGKIDASAPTGIGNDQIVGTGSGGRIALYTQSPIVFPMDNVACSGTGYRGTSWAWNSRVSGAGTIYVYDPTQMNGTLYVKQSTTVSTQNSKWTGTPVMGDLALDAVVLSGRTFLRIPEGASLTLPSLAAVTTDNTGAGQAGLVYDGGTLNIGSGSQTLKANVAFSSPTAFSFPGDLTLETGAKLGSLNSMYGTAANDYDQTFTVSVAGNLTIPADASAGATRCCALTASGKARYAASHGGQSLYLAAEARTNGFDSVLNPSMPGGSANCNFPAGGAFTLTVGGTLTLDGPMTADGGGARGSDSTYDGTSAGAGGTLNVTAGALAGAGKMSAEGGCGLWNYAGGAGGGRIAVRLTGNGSTFSDYWKTNITAYGESFSGGNGKASSAGTVYLQEKSAGEAAGTVVVRNDLAIRAAAANNNAVTLYPGNGDGCDAPSALKKTRLLIDGASRVELTDDLRLIGLTMASDTALDLNGKTLVVNKATLGGVKLAPGTYAAGDATVAGFVVDSVTGGTLVVTGGGLAIIVR